VKTPILDEDLVCMYPCHDHAGQVNALAFTLERVHIRDRFRSDWIEMDPVMRHEFEIGAIPRHREHEVVLDGYFAFRRRENDVMRPDLFHGAMKVSLHFPRLNAVLD